MSSTTRSSTTPPLQQQAAIAAGSEGQRLSIMSQGLGPAYSMSAEAMSSGWSYAGNWRPRPRAACASPKAPTKSGLGPSAFERDDQDDEARHLDHGPPSQERVHGTTVPGQLLLYKCRHQLFCYKNVFVNEERIHVQHLHGSIPYVHISNARALHKRFPDRCEHLVLQASCMVRLRKGVEEFVRERRFDGTRLSAGTC